MSSSTSPRSGNSVASKMGSLDHPLTQNVSPHSRLALPEVVDPVALIDERIKVSLSVECSVDLMEGIVCCFVALHVQ